MRSKWVGWGNRFGGTKMTLTDYINQVEPQRMPNVVLKRHEYSIRTLPKSVRGEVEHQVFIRFPFKWEQSIIKINPYFRNEYKAFGSHPCTLYTTDRDGNAKERSCFRLPLK